jgi:hypothetical protein
MRYKITALALAALAFTACKKDEEAAPDDHSHDPATANVSLGFSLMQGENDYTLDSLLTDSLGHKIKLNTLRFFVSGIHAEDDADVVVGEWDDAYLLVDAGNSANTFALGSITAAHIHQFHFSLGLDSATNHADPTVAEAPLNDASMHWNWNPAAGYKFLVVEGRVDDDGDGVVDAGDPEIVYHCATDALLTEAHAHEHHDVVSGENYVAPVHVDLAQLFAGIDAVTTTGGMGDTPVNVRLMQNLAGSIDGAE